MPKETPRTSRTSAIPFAFLVVASAAVIAEAVTIGWLINLQGSRIERLAARQDQLAENFSTLASKISRSGLGAPAAQGAATAPAGETFAVSETGALVRLGADGKDDVVVPDVRAAGVTLTDCTSPADLGEYLALPDRVLFVEGCGEMGGAMWSFDRKEKTFARMAVRYAFGTENPSPDLRYQVRLGKEDADREVRMLHVADFVNDKEYDVGQLPKRFSYVQGYSEFNGAPYGRINWRSAGLPFAEVYLTDTPELGLFENRLPVFEKFINLGELAQ